MDRPDPADDDLLALPVRMRLLTTLAGLRRPATTQELADLVGRHHNSTRVQLQLLAERGLVERRLVAQARGRPRHEWTIAATGRPAGDPPQAHGDLSRWLARAIARSRHLDDVEAAGREIGHELAPALAQRGVREALHDALASLGFAPEEEDPGPGTIRYVLTNCPYRRVAAENPAVVCSLHRGITLGLIERVAPEARLAGFTPKDPYAAGCLVDVQTV
jgi:predicted ArsR family transcriptional regulator